MSLWILVMTCGAWCADTGRYEAAMQWPQRTENKVFRDRVRPNWLPDGHAFWYRSQIGPDQFEFVLIDCKTGARKTAATLPELGLPEVDVLKTSATLLEWRATSRRGESSALRFVNRLDDDVELFWINSDGRQVSYGRLTAGSEREQHTYDGHVWLITDHGGQRLAIVEGAPQPRTIVIDGPGRAPPLSKPARATDKRQNDPREFRSPNGRFTAKLEVDQVVPRKVTLVETSPVQGLQPRLKVFDYFKPGDELPKPQWVIHRDDGTQTRIAREMYDNVFTENGLLEARWAPDNSEFYFNYNRRGHQCYRILAVNAATGQVRVVVDESSPTFIDYTKKTWRHWLPATNELIWMSERDGWCHLYLYDVRRGEVQRQITRGNWVTREVLRVDEQRREIWFLASGLCSEEDPYHQHLCRVNLAGDSVQRLTSADGNHHVVFSPQGDYFIDTWSRVDHPPVSELRRSDDGSLISELERADATALLATGWKMPERFVAKGRDGRTDIHGILIKPSHFDPDHKYPIVEEVYAGPHGAFVPKDFDRQTRLYQMAELGFIVVKVDGMGTNHRGKTFHDVCWKNLQDAGFPDRKRWIAAAAQTRNWMDLSRVGIYGGSAGGQSALRALLDHHDFYHVAVADCGCHDNRMDKIWWNEQWLGWPVDESYVRSSNAVDADKLKGQLLLIVGELDTNVDPASTMQVVAALQKANKTFEFMPIINAGHGAAETPYGSKLRREFFVKHLKP